MFLTFLYHVVPHCANVDHNASKFHTRASVEVQEQEKLKKSADAAELKIKFRAKVSPRKLKQVQTELYQLLNSSKI